MKLHPFVELVDFDGLLVDFFDVEVLVPFIPVRLRRYPRTLRIYLLVPGAALLFVEL